MITVIDYGAGNLRSVENALRYLDAPYRITSQPSEVADAKALLLPGVGHFGQMMRSLELLGITPVLRKAIGDGIPYFGICLGMQALFQGSEEAPSHKGLAILPGTIRRFPEQMPQGFKVPHMGWNRLSIAPQSRLFGEIGAHAFVYFAHSYYLPDRETVSDNRPLAAARCDYAGQFVAAIERENIFGVQFHPEKSGETGLQVVANFARLCGSGEKASTGSTSLPGVRAGGGERAR